MADSSNSGPLGFEQSEVERLRTSEEHFRVENENLREALRDIEHARDTYFELHDLAAIPLLTLDREGAIRKVNLAAAELLGCGRSALLGRMLLSFASSHDRVSLNQHVLACQHKMEVVGELRFTLAKGSTPVRLKSRYVNGNSGPVILVALLDDRENAYATVEKEKLRDAAQRATRASESKDQFIAMLSHELRTPLTPILALCSAMKDDTSLDPALRSVFSRIARNADAEARLIDDLLDATGIMRGKMNVVTMPTDVHELLTECVLALQPEANSKQQHVLLELDAKRQWVAGDHLRLRQVFTNLLRNAIKFTPLQGSIHVRSWNGEGRLQVEVQDSGIGFAPESTRRIFQPFDQLNEEGRVGGLGLGLAIAKGLVELHLGKIDAASRGTGHGARFVVELPTIATPLVIAKSQPLASAVPPSRGTRVLLVEDNEDTAEVFAKLLRLKGYAVVVVGSVHSALAAYAPEIDMIVSDVGLPDGTGIDLIRKLHSIRRRPAIALSGFGMAQDVKACKDAGFDVHLTKPITAGRLFAAIQSLSPPNG